MRVLPTRKGWIGLAPPEPHPGTFAPVEYGLSRHPLAKPKEQSRDSRRYRTVLDDISSRTISIGIKPAEFWPRHPQTTLQRALSPALPRPLHRSSTTRTPPSPRPAGGLSTRSLPVSHPGVGLAVKPSLLARDVQNNARLAPLYLYVGMRKYNFNASGHPSFCVDGRA